MSDHNGQDTSLSDFSAIMRDAMSPAVSAISAIVSALGTRNDSATTGSTVAAGPTSAPAPIVDGSAQLVEALGKVVETFSIAGDHGSYGVQGDPGKFDLQPMVETAGKLKGSFEQLLVASLNLTEEEMRAKSQRHAETASPKLTPAAAAEPSGPSGLSEAKAILSGFGSAVGQATATIANMVGMGGALKNAIGGIQNLWAGAKQVATGKPAEKEQKGTAGTAAATALASIVSPAQQAAAALQALAATARAFTPTPAPAVRDAAGSVLPSVSNKPITNGGRGSPPSGPPAAPAAEASTGDMVGTALGGLGAMAGAVGAVVSALGQAVQASTQFVAALAPSTVEAMNLAYRELQATIGEALLPIIQTATGVFRDMAAVLLPVMESLQPVIRQMAQVLGSEVVVVFEALAEVISGLLPVFDALAEVQKAGLAVFRAVVAVIQAVLMPAISGLANMFEALKPVIQVLTAWIEGVALIWQTAANIFRALSETWNGFMKSLMPAVDAKSWVEGIRSAFQTIAKSLLLASVAIMDFAGVASYRANILKTLAGPEKKSAAGKAAATGATIKSFADIGRDVSLAAAVASGTLGDKKDDPEAKWREEVVEALKKQDPEAMKNWVNTQIEAFAQRMENAIRGAASGTAWDLTKSAFEYGTVPGLINKGIRGVAGAFGG